MELPLRMLPLCCHSLVTGDFHLLKDTRHKAGRPLSTLRPRAPFLFTLGALKCKKRRAVRGAKPSLPCPLAVLCVKATFPHPVLGDILLNLQPGCSCFPRLLLLTASLARSPPWLAPLDYSAPPGKPQRWHCNMVVWCMLVMPHTLQAHPCHCCTTV
jgi:hypothetical protein